MNTEEIGAIVVAAGSSSRLGTDKIFLPLGGKPVLSWSVDILQSSPQVNRIVIVLNETNISRGTKMVKRRKWDKVSDICRGGKRRQDSVKEGLLKLKGCKWVIIHDGARPFITRKIIESGLVTARETGAAVAAVPVKDTVKLSDSGLTVEKTLQRQNLWAVQTPQTFRFDIIFEAHEKISKDVTDDAMMVEELGYPVKISEGSYNNIKITSAEDIALARIFARSLKCA